ncbi:AAA family ATPase [Ruminococcaceae bacterium OttesenSCG-928-L11]|nr:AAA family ATPase [Ruminococcaceae bacterium OttesenSCG-928-L11]
MEQDYQLNDVVTPYRQESEYHQDLLWLVSVYLVYAIRLKQSSIDGELAANIPGFYMAQDEAVRYVTGYPAEYGETPETIYPHILAGKELIRRRLDMTSAAPDYRMQRLRERFALSEIGFFAVLCAYACQTDRGFEQMFAMLHNDNSLCGPTFGVIHSIFFAVEPLEWGADMTPLLPGTRNHDILFVTGQDAPEGMTKIPLQLRWQVVAYLSGQGTIGASVATHGRVIEPAETPVEIRFLGEAMEELRHAVGAARLRRACSATLLCGPRGSGKKESLRAIAAETGARFLLIRFNSLMEGKQSAARIADLILPVLLEDYLLCFEHIGSVADDFGQQLYSLLEGLAPHCPGLFLLFENLKTNLSCEGYFITRVDYPYPTQEQALEFWNTFAQGREMSPEVDFKALSSKYILTPGQIQTALQSAAMRKGADGGSIGSGDLARAVLLNNANRLSELAEQVPIFYTWEDLVLDEHPLFLLKSVCNRLRYRYQVENEWGFRSKASYGKGISVLLFGPPGTGKTMSAQVIAGELELPLYRIDLSRIISKYIGETAKNLDAIFNEAKASNVILFFDEADSLFSRRTDVKNSNDRHSNSEISYLLQKIEDYAGISILATNLAQNFDEAFRRRINYMINIHMPNPAQRLRLWKKALPAETPLDPSVDFALLADSLELSGSVIKSAVTQAAYFAMEDAGAVTMTHIVRAVRLELDKLGKSEPHFMQYY